VAFVNRSDGADKLAQREERLIRACEIANQYPELRKVEREFDALADEIPETWEDAPSGEI